MRRKSPRGAVHRNFGQMGTVSRTHDHDLYANFINQLPHPRGWRFRVLCRCGWRYEFEDRSHVAGKSQGLGAWRAHSSAKRLQPID